MTDGQQGVTRESRTFFSVIDAIAARYRLVLGAPFAAAVLTSIAVLLMRPMFASSASFVPEQRAGPRLPAGLSGLASQFGLNLGGEASRSPDFYADLLRGKELLGSLLSAEVSAPTGGSDTVTLLQLYGVKEENPEKRREEGIKALRNHIRVGVNPRTNVVQLTVEARSPTAARDVVQLLLDRLADFNLHTRQSIARERRTFIETRVEATERELRRAEEALRGFYERNRQWQSSPQLQFEEQRLNRQVNVQQDLYLTLRREYELARVEEVNNTPVLTVIDQPTVPGRRVRPRRTFTVLAVTLIVGILAAGGAVLLQGHQDLLAAGNPEYARLHRRFQRLLRRPSPHDA